MHSHTSWDKVWKCVKLLSRLLVASLLLEAKDPHKLFQQTCRVYYANKSGPATHPLPNCKIQYFAFDVSQTCKVLTITNTHTHNY